MYRTHTCGDLTKKHAGKDVTLSGWVHKRRNFGSLVFIDLRDRYGLTQVVFHPEKMNDFSVVESLKYEYVVRVTGKVVKRDKKNVNKELATGEVEVAASNVEVLSRSKPVPFEIFDARKSEEEEELRLKYRYLELRREKLRDNILFRAKMVRHMRDYMEKRGFVDIATPILTVSSPEGARDFLVPSRLHPGKFYALPQAPQQYKQLLMVAGFDRYYQIAPCLRDEDPRADRSPGEFYQLDCETSFLKQDEFLALVEPLFVELTKKLAGKKVLKTPFPMISYKEAMEKYGTDKPDLRFGLELQDVSEWAKKTSFKVFAGGEYVRALVVSDGSKFSRNEIDREFEEAAQRAKAKGLAVLRHLKGVFEGNIAKFFSKEQLTELKSRLNLKNDEAVFFVSDNWEISCKALGAVRQLVSEKRGLVDPNLIAWAWIVDFPMYEFNKQEDKIEFGHNPFSMPQGGLVALQTKPPLEVLAHQYDLVANGCETASGAVRNMDPEIMYKAFEIAGHSKNVVNQKFGHMLGAFEFGAPPHCGFAAGIERLVMLFTGEKNIRAVVPFPKNQKAEEPMVGSPSEVGEEQLSELHVKVLRDNEAG